MIGCRHADRLAYRVSISAVPVVLERNNTSRSQKLPTSVGSNAAGDARESRECVEGGATSESSDRIAARSTETDVPSRAASSNLRQDSADERYPQTSV